MEKLLEKLFVVANGYGVGLILIYTRKREQIIVADAFLKVSNEKSVIEAKRFNFDTTEGKNATIEKKYVMELMYNSAAGWINGTFNKLTSYKHKPLLPNNYDKAIDIGTDNISVLFPLCLEHKDLIEYIASCAIKPLEETLQGYLKIAATIKADKLI
ncbi:MAG: hypothetical protein D5S00_00760 [Tindallia sp. MSAO_Bac2]|nr:MAG: hypothetical protein D5S00_00760 [Tindallia sp. MSAO_Bac2]